MLLFPESRKVSGIQHMYFNAEESDTTERLNWTKLNAEFESVQFKLESVEWV